MSDFFDNGTDKEFPYSNVLSRYRKRHPNEINSDANIAYLEGKIDALKDVMYWKSARVRDHTAYLGDRPLYGYVLMMQQFAEEMAGSILTREDKERT